MRKRINTRINDFCDIIEELLQPDATIVQMHECRFFSEDSKERIFSLYKKLMYMSRAGMELDIVNEIKQDVTYINKFFDYLDFIKKELLKVTKIMKTSWKKEIDKNIKQEYFG